jgi:hypothetical protein
MYTYVCVYTYIMYIYIEGQTLRYFGVVCVCVCVCVCVHTHIQIHTHTHAHTHTHTLSTGGLVTSGRAKPARRWLALKSINCAAARMHSIVATLSTLLPPAPDEAVATASTCGRLK